MSAWRRVRLDWIASVGRHTVDPAGLISDDVFHYSIPVLDEIGDGQVELSESVGSDKLLLSGGEVLVSKLNPRKPRVVVAEAKTQPVLASTEFIALVPREVDRRFLIYWLKSEKTRQNLDGAVQSVTRSHQRIRPELLMKMWVDLPNGIAQRAIADFLDAETARIDALIGKKRQLRQLLNTRLAILARSLVFTQTNMKKVRLGRVASILPGYAFSSSDFRNDAEGAIRLLRGINVAPGRCRWEEVAYLPEPQLNQHKTYTLSPGDLVLGMDRPFISEGTRVARVEKTDVPALLVQRVARIRTKETLNAKYLSFALHSDVFKDHCTPITTGVSVPHISADQVADFRVPLPERKVQDRIAARLTNEEIRINTLRDQISRQADLLTEHRQALITAAVTGQIEVPRAAAELGGSETAAFERRGCL